MSSNRTGGSLACPVIQAMPEACSIVIAKPVRSRHGPDRPKAGIRHITARGFRAWISFQPSPKFSITRGAKFSTTRSAHSMSRLARASPSG